MRGHFTTSSRTSRPRPKPRLARPIALVLVVGSLTIPTSAGAMYGSVSDQGSVPDENTTGSGQLVTPDHSALDASLAPTEGLTAPTVAAATRSPVADGDGFDWADAALGAGITMALAALAGGAVLGLRRQPDASPRASTS